MSYHGVAYIETAPLLYPGGKSILCQPASLYLSRVCSNTTSRRLQDRSIQRNGIQIESKFFRRSDTVDVMT